MLNIEELKYIIRDCTDIPEDNIEKFLEYYKGTITDFDSFLELASLTVIMLDIIEEAKEFKKET